MMHCLSRRSPSSPAEEHTHKYEETDNSIPAETEPAAAESWVILKHHRIGPSSKDGVASFLTLCCPPDPSSNNHNPAYSSVSLRLMGFFFLSQHCVLRWSETRTRHSLLELFVFLEVATAEKESFFPWWIVVLSGPSLVFLNVLFLLYDARPVINPVPPSRRLLLSSRNHKNYHISLWHHKYIKR